MANGKILPTWRGLLTEMLRWAAQIGTEISPKERQAFRLLLSRDSPRHFAKAAGWLRAKVGESHFSDFLTETFNTSSRILSRFHQRLAELPHKGIITFNYDCLLETALPSHHCTSQLDPTKLAYIHKGYYKPFIFKAHGEIGRPDSIVLGHKDYAQLLYHNPAYRKVMSTLFEQHTILALGCGLEDPDLESLLDDTLAIFPNPPLKVFALVPKGRYDVITRELWLRERKIHLLEYRPSSEDHPEVPEFVDRLVTIAINARKHTDDRTRATMHLPVTIAPLVADLKRAFIVAQQRIRNDFAELRNGEKAALARGKLADGTLKALWRHAAKHLGITTEGIVLVAKGEYGMGLLSSVSNVNVSMLHRGEVTGAAESLFSLLHPLITDSLAGSGLSATPVLNSVEECVAKWKVDNHSFIAFAEVRRICGDASVQESISQSWREYARNLNWAAFRAKLRTERLVAAETGSVGAESIRRRPGGLLDLFIIQCIVKVMKYRGIDYLGGQPDVKPAWSMWTEIAETLARTPYPLCGDRMSCAERGDEMWCALEKCERTVQSTLSRLLEPPSVI